MNLRVATYNVNNLFERATVFRPATGAPHDGYSETGAEVLQDIQRLTELFDEASYKGAVKGEIVSLLEKYKFHTETKNPWFTIREIRKTLFSVKQDKSGVTLTAAGRDSWVGWVDLLRDAVHQTNTENTARVIQAMKADLLGLEEVEDRLTLDRFNTDILRNISSQ